jgi:hypothetical protein
VSGGLQVNNRPGIQPADSAVARGAQRPVQDILDLSHHRSAARFGSQAVFTANDINAFNPDLLRTFRSMFKPGTRMVSAPSMEHPVMLREVVANDVDKIELKNPYDPQKTDVIPLDDEHLQVYARQILMNLPLLNNEVSHPKDLWIKLFQQVVDQVGDENQKRDFSPLAYANVDNKKKIYQPCGFTLSGNLFMLRNPDFTIEGEPINDPLKGEANEPMDMFLSFLPEKRRQYYEKPEHSEETWTKITENLLVVPPKNLRPLYCEGMYEKAGFVFLPA